MQRCHFLAPHNLKIMAPMRRKSHGSIRSPHVKRDSQSQVVIEGWLYKLEGGALKQWKQRWCVLADFCLFFYKGPHEEKVTSSILLPSYKINPCSTEDKISRKFAFKAEHQNMKTYYFAAEDKESMKRWMNAMSLASIMQKFVKSENFDATFSSASNDDEESGFSSYRSRRYTSHKLNSTYDPSFIHEPLKQRSNSCGDRMGEVYLGSDDKYPNTFKSIPSHLYKASCTPHDAPRRQPLYANAPPKPKRLTQSEGFPIYPNECYDTRDSMSSSQYHCEMQSSRIHSGHQNQNAKTYLPMETNVSHPPNLDMEYRSAPKNIDHAFAQNAGVEHFSDVYKNQPPRPHSADFLERDSECHVPPDTVKCCENLQPQRPKSSLECYNRYVDSEEEDFDDYREAVRVQADNLYANKNLLKPRYSRVPAQETCISTSDQKLNIHYVGNSYFRNKDYMPSSYRAKSIMNEQPDVCPQTTQSSYPQNSNIQTSQSKSRKSREESMQRLLEWKQRMLQSPLSKRNHLQSNSSSDTSSPMNSPLKTGMQNQYQKQVRKELESHEAELRKYALSGHNKYSYSSPEPNSQPYACKVYNNYMSGKQYQNQQVCDSKVPSFDYESQGDYYTVSKPVQTNSNLSMNDSRVCMTENICQENLMYCVDSENNEILFSYDDNSFSSCNISKTLQNSHYPPQMHSFSTMHNVSDIGNESQDLSTQDGCNSSEQLSVKDEYKKFNNSQEMLDTSNSSAVELQATAYSSDDEDGITEECDLNPKAKTSKEQKSDIYASCEDQLLTDRYHSSSPDYVNIGAFSGELQADSSQKMYSANALYKNPSEINHAVLKPLEQVSKNLHFDDQQNAKVIQPIMKHPELTSCSNTSSNFNKVDLDQSVGHQQSEAQLYQQQKCKDIDSRFMYEDEAEFDIKREDYYRASQIYYASTRMKNKHNASEQHTESKDILPASRTQPYANFPWHTAYGKDKKNLSNLDKDVGIPLPAPSCKLVSKTNAPNAKSSFQSTHLNDKNPCSNSLDFNPPEKITEPKLIQDFTVAGVVCETEKKSLSYEEMRGQLLRKREAPPPNIVQDRIKKFETVDYALKSNKNMSAGNVTSSSLPSDTPVQKEAFISRGLGKRSRLKTNRMRSNRRILHSDSEAVAMEGTDESSDDLTMKSAPILLSPLSSVLADLRKTADSGKEKYKPPSREPVIHTNNMKEYFLAFNDDTSKMTSQKTYLKKINKRVTESHVNDTATESLENGEAEYLPMCGIKILKEPEYVTMSSSKLCSSSASDPKLKNTSEGEEHVYNEPFSPPQSFLHDVYEKQKTKQFQYHMKSSSSDDSLTENIYEKPMHRFGSSSGSRSMKSEYTHNSVQETNFVLMSSLSCSNVTAVGRSSEVDNRDYLRSNKNNASRRNMHHYEEMQLSVSVPDLLQLQEMKDSDASDADDEASRDFDTTANAPLSSYQSSVLDQFPIENERNIEMKPGCNSSFNSAIPCNSSFNSEIPHNSEIPCKSSFNSEIATFAHEDHLNSSDLYYFHQYSSSTNNVSYQKEHEILPQVKPLPSYEAVTCSNSGSALELNCGQMVMKKESSDDEKKIHVRKLRVYTKGKKPEAPKIFPVPFNLEDSEICKIIERKDAKHLNSVPSSTSKPINSNVPDDASLLESAPQTETKEMCHDNSLIESSCVSYKSSYTPDIIPSIIEDTRSLHEKSSTSKSPNSAPYYYSDLFGHSEQLCLRRNEMPYFDKTSPQKNNPALLNNIRSKSPSSLCKGDVGRKVNKINNKEYVSDDKIVQNEKPLIKYWKGEGTKCNIRSSLDIFQCSKSKYLDAEKNKYEAGHTLEKTRSSSTMSYFKHRSSTPDLNICQYQSDEPVYENIVFQPKLPLQKRLSQSLEGIPNAPEFIDEKKVQCSPVYENIQFFNQIESVEKQVNTNDLRSALPSPEDIKTSNRSSKQISSLSDACVLHYQQFSEVAPSAQPYESSRIDKPDLSDNDIDFLDQNMLRQVSKKHFFGKNFRYNIPASSFRNELFKNSSEYLKEPSLIKHDKGNTYSENKLLEASSINAFPDGFKDKPNESDSTSAATSSCDEASLDSDGRFKSANSKVKYHGFSRASSSFESNVKELPTNSTISCSCIGELCPRCCHNGKFPVLGIHKNNCKMKRHLPACEPSYVKKLVQQSEGLMCKGKRLSVSACDLLGKTHEELVLLLIQLRRNQAKILRSKEKLEQQLENEQKLPQQSSLGQQLPSQNYKEIRLQIRQLENQYEVTQPLVTLVDNMVKLGSLYGSSHRRSFSLPLLDSSQDEPRHSVEVAQSPEHVGESSILSKLLTEENNLQKRISEIYSLDKGLRHETNSITSLHQDKKMLEHTLCGMQNKILDHQDKPGELQKLRKQQRMIEKELVRVKRLLSTSAKKIEDAASKNDQMEQEILLLRQILQQALKTGSSDLQASQHNRADLEAELTRLQNVLDELANHRHEINNTVEKLKSEARSSMSKGTEVRASPTGVAGSAPLPLRKKQHSTYLETDLDTMTTRDLAIIHEKDGDDIPVYANAEEINSANEETCLKEVPSLNENAQQAHFSQGDSTEPKQCSMQDINDADERMKRFYGILPKEKPSEIKTVRIVKRQSERRNRERDKKRVTYDDQSSVWVVEEPDISSDDPLDAEEGNNKSTPLSHRPSSIYLFSSNTSRQTNTQSAHERLFGSSSKKETSSTENQDHVSSSRRSKRRHYTVSGYQYMLDPQFMQYFKDRPRSRDDVDMERCLRTANTPDIVRSTIKKKEVFDDKIIERELGLPQKIEIPERYVEVESEELSASEKLRRSLKAENICKMLSETTTTYEDVEERSKSPEALHKKLSEEKRKRAHLLSLNRALAREVVERSKAVAANVCSPENQASN